MNTTPDGAPRAANATAWAGGLLAIGAGGIATIVSLQEIAQAQLDAVPVHLSSRVIALWIACALALTVALIARGRVRRYRRIQSDLALAAEWEAFWKRRDAGVGGRVGQVVGHRWQPRPKGTATVIRWLDDNTYTSTWWHQRFPQPGEVYSLRQRGLRPGDYEPTMDVFPLDILDGVGVAQQSAWARAHGTKR